MQSDTGVVVGPCFGSKLPRGNHGGRDSFGGSKSLHSSMLLSLAQSGVLP